MDKAYSELALKYIALKSQLFENAYKHKQNKSLLNLIKDVGLFEEYIGFCSLQRQKNIR